MYNTVYLATVLCAALLTAALTPLAMRFGRQWGLVDQPGGRRKHNGIIARTGGLAIFGGFFVTVILTLLLPGLLPQALYELFPVRADPAEGVRLLALLAGSVVCVSVGLIDDRLRLPSLPQYLTQIVAALIAIGGLIFLKHINNPLPVGGKLLGGDDGLPFWLWIPLTIFWFMGMMNTINFLDGLSGLVTGVTAILCCVLAIHMVTIQPEPQSSVALLPLALLGATLGFLPFNFSPARIFMGSSGSYFLGFAIAALGIIGGARMATVMMVLGLPAIDVAWLIISRWRRGVSPNQGGRDHLHFRLLDLGLSERTIVIGYWLFCALFGALTLLLDNRLHKLIALIFLGLIALGVIVWASRTEDNSGGS